MREGGAWDGEPEPWRVGAAGISKKAEVTHQHWLMEPPPRNWGAMKTWVCWEHAHPATA